MTLHNVQQAQGADFAPDGIPLNFGDLHAEYHAALQGAVIMDRSHEARLALTGAARFDLMHRISTNDLLNLAAGEGRPTIFTNANARILDRVDVYNHGEQALVLGQPGRGAALLRYLQGQIFFGDDVQLQDLAPAYAQFDLHGPQAADVLQRVTAADIEPLHTQTANIAGAEVIIARRKPISGTHWTLLVAHEQAADVWQAITSSGAQPAGSLTFNTLRIRAGLPGVGRELSTDYIPLEVGLWDEVSFTKGCYTGQEIIARMESRNRLAKTIVALQMADYIPAPAEVYSDGRSAGRLTSSVTAPDGAIYTIAVIKTPLAQPGQALTVGDQHIPATVAALLGVQPEHPQP